MSEGSEANRDAAKQALDIARRKLASGEIEAAVRFCTKSISLFSTTTAQSLLKELQALQREGSGSRASTSSSSASTSNGYARPAKASNGETSAAKERVHTPEQAALVKRIRSCRATDYYEILSIQKDAEEVHIKKAYRKLALSLHPDKNGAPGADEAFKLVSKAFQVLSDPQKRSAHDSHGSDPDDRSTGFSRSPFAASRGGGGGGMYSDEVSPEELFNMFFPGGMGRSGMRFGGGSPFGGSGVHFSTFGNGRPQRPAQARDPNAPQQPAWVQLLPLILLVAFSLLTQLPSLFTTPPTPDPSFSFERSTFFDLERETHSNIKASYFVNSRQYANHPFFASLVEANPDKLVYPIPGSTAEATHVPPAAKGSDIPDETATAPAQETTITPAASLSNERQEHALAYPTLPTGLKIPRDYARFEQGIEQAYLRRLQEICQFEIQDRNERLNRARGFLGLGADWDEVRRQEQRVLEGCNKLRSLGYRIG